ncbi:hypothetical protein PR048_010091 [Dryococelus australis]|uniref:Uncharacterized protein n=1 Tax=Dryococelus australis TaxID=614101 RepID=A0ABQ9I1Q5_9NEOP|nr:hypothetical protein PR048_010091 [Dryococelus australis]
MERAVTEERARQLASLTIKLESQQPDEHHTTDQGDGLTCPKPRSEGAIRATLTRTPSVSSPIRARLQRFRRNAVLCKLDLSLYSSELALPCDGQPPATCSYCCTHQHLLLELIPQESASPHSSSERIREVIKEQGRECKGRGTRDNSEKTSRPPESSVNIPTRENSGATPLVCARSQRTLPVTGSVLSHNCADICSSCWELAVSTTTDSSSPHLATICSKIVTSLARPPWLKPNRVKRGEVWSSAGMKLGVGGREIPEKTRFPETSSGTIPAWESSSATPPGLEPGTLWWEASNLTTKPPRPQEGGERRSAVLEENCIDHASMCVYPLSFHVWSSANIPKGDCAPLWLAWACPSTINASGLFQLIVRREDSRLAQRYTNPQAFVTPRRNTAPGSSHAWGTFVDKCTDSIANESRKLSQVNKCDCGVSTSSDMWYGLEAPDLFDTGSSFPESCLILANLWVRLRLESDYCFPSSSHLAVETMLKRCTRLKSTDFSPTGHFRRHSSLCRLAVFAHLSPELAQSSELTSPCSEAYCGLISLAELPGRFPAH